MEGKLESQDFEKYLSLSEKEARTALVASNDAFILAMARAVKAGAERATPGTFIDRTPRATRRIVADFSR